MTRTMVAMGMAMACFAAAPAASQTAAQWTDSNAGYAAGVLKQYPRIGRTWRAIVPRRYKNVDWVSGLWGNTSTPTIVNVAGVQYALGGVCKPHDCYDNGAAYLIAVDGRRAVGVLLFAHSKIGTDGVFHLARVTETYLGKPAPFERALLHQQIMRGRS